MSLLLIALIVLFVVDVMFFSFEKYEWSIGVMVVSIGLAYWFSPELAAFVKSSWPVLLTQYVPVYLGLGFVTAVVKWIIHNFKYVATIREAKEKFDIKNPVDGHVNLDEDNHRTQVDRQEFLNALTPEQVVMRRRKAFIKYFRSSSEYGRSGVYEVDYSKETAVVDALTPRAKDNIGVITIWILQWPLVVVSTLISDLIVKLGKHAARLFDLAFSYFSRKLVANATKGL